MRNAKVSKKNIQAFKKKCYFTKTSLQYGKDFPQY